MTVDENGMETTKFFADLTREVTHELANVMSVIGELSGLLGDLAAANRTGRPIAPEKVESLAKRIDAQVERGASIVQHFNRFAHSLDDPGGEVDLAEVLSRFSVLSKRIVARHRMTLAIDVPDRVTIRGDAYEFYRLLFALLRRWTSDNASLAVSLSSDETRAVLEWSGNRTPPVAAEATDVSALVERLSGSLTVTPDGKWGVTLSRQPVVPKEKEKAP